MGKSTMFFNQAKKVIPGGVSSPVRAFGSVEDSPPFIVKAKGPYVWDCDGNQYLDFVGSWGTAILGHAPDSVIAAVQNACTNGFSFGASHPGESELAGLIIAAFPSIEKVRFVNSGTEACMTAIRLARGYTGKDKIAKFTGHYHGHSDSLLVKGGSGLLTHAVPDSVGVPKSFVEQTLTLPFNNFEALEELFKKHAKSLSAVILEPIAANCGFVRPKEGFLERLKSLCSKNDTLLIFDEVITGFRVAYGGVQNSLNIKPDLTILGKVIGGGFPLAALCGKAEIMDYLAPNGPVYQAGTLSGNPIAVAAGIKTLKTLAEMKPYKSLHSLTQFLTKELHALGNKYNIPIQVDCEGALFGYFFAPEKITSYEQLTFCDKKLFQRFFSESINQSIYLAPSLYEAGFISTCHLEEHIEKALQVFDKVLKKIS
ncbi:MAG: glutamate-1-semialdehyde-2,1-aminomutase [Zetaproteobacteria bacterium]|nr:glutamate-1-semialdehyde-2,1-aminomutase [Pseudobdellovibrionaceae bacterium]